MQESKKGYIHAKSIRQDQKKNKIAPLTFATLYPPKKRETNAIISKTDRHLI
jgi:hypothetical protein